ncbi:hypothetical protein [Isoptericola sp. NPDC057559]|uniref:hypothetical protein n=1 Tax=Isoptericola sp. NPDC057559 TaxID=3346168 RepID=UPI00369B45ED
MFPTEHGAVPIRPGTPRWPAVAASVLLVSFLAACGPAGATPGDGSGPRAVSESGHGDHGGEHDGTIHDEMSPEVHEAYGQVKTERGRAILSDGLVTAAEVEDLRQVQVDCLRAAGFDAGRDEGGLQIRAVPDGLDEDGVAAAVEVCLGDLRIVGPLGAEGASAS